MAQLFSPLKLLVNTEMASLARVYLDNRVSEEQVPACCKKAGHRVPLAERLASWAPVEATDNLTAAAIMLQSVTSVRLMPHTPCRFDCPQTLWLVDDVLTDVAHRDRKNAYWVRAMGQCTISVRQTNGALEFSTTMGALPLEATT